MTSTEILLVLNSILLGVISLLFLGIGYFLKDLHKDFKGMMEKVHELHNELATHVTLFENLTKIFQKQIDALRERVKKVETTLHKTKSK
jgi:predicted small metal-binding protein